MKKFLKEYFSRGGWNIPSWQFVVSFISLIALIIATPNEIGKVLIIPLSILTLLPLLWIIILFLVSSNIDFFLKKSD